MYPLSVTWNALHSPMCVQRISSIAWYLRPVMWWTKHIISGRTKTKKNKTEFCKQNSTSRLIFESGSSEVKNIFTIRKPIHDFLSNFYWHFFSISYCFRDIRLQSFQGLTLTFDLWGSSEVKNYFHHLKAHIWLPIQIPLTLSLYIVPFSRYSTSKVSGFDLDLWPSGVTLSQKYFHHLKAHIWLPIQLPLTLSLYLVPFSRYSTSKFLGFDLDL